MPTDITNSIGATGRDYSTISAWESASPVSGSSASGQGLVAADERWIGELYDDANPSFTENILIGGATVDSTRYRWLRPAAGQQYDHLTDAGVDIRPANEFGIHEVDEPFARVGMAGRPLCCRGASAVDPRGGALIVQSLAAGGDFDSLVFRFAGSGINACIHGDFAGSATRDVFVMNCIFMDCSSTNAINIDTNAQILNNTVLNSGTSGISTTGSARTPIAVAKNNIVLTPRSGSCFTTADNWGTGTDNNLSTDATAPGANSIHSVTASNVIVDTTTGSEDLHLKSGSPAINAGTTDTDAPTDHEGVGRPQGAAYDIGAFEFVSVAVMTADDGGVEYEFIDSW